MRFLYIFLALILPVKVFSQSANAPLNRDYYHLIDRYEIMSGQFSNTFHTSVKPIRREMIGEFLDSLDMKNMNASGVDRFNFEYLAIDNWSFTSMDSSDSRKSILKYFYRKKNDFFYVMEENFEFHLNPVFHFSGGMEKDQDVTTYINTRGLEASGIIANRIGYYTFAATTQAAFPSYTRDWINRYLVVPGEGFWKRHNVDGVDFFTARGYISFNVVDQINIQFGFDKEFRGNGHRSMILSDFSSNYTFLKFNTKVWKFNYSNLFTQMYADAYGSTISGSTGGAYPRKFMAHHHLSFNVTKNLNIGLFENVIIGDSTERFNIGYLNPMIFYRAFEHQEGSGDNIMIGLDFKWNFLRHFSWYGSFLLDEFLLSEVKEGNGWWANKYGLQTGIKYIDIFGLQNLDLTIEYNESRPYTFAHIDMYGNYAHYGQPLAHPTGANFREILTILRYQPLDRLTFVGKFIYSNYGEDDENSNWGKNVLLSYVSREKEYGNYIGQGYPTDLVYIDLITTYQLKHNVFFDLVFQYRNVNSEYAPHSGNSVHTSAGFRWNIPKRDQDF
ncbi:hypothetical protein ACFLU5_11460 [Bacteroidota bacterium]